MGKFCSNCGKEVGKTDAFCQYCGGQIAEEVKAEKVTKVETSEGNPNNGMAVAGFILSFFVPLLGLIFSIVGVVKSKNLNGAGKGLAIAGIIISAVSMVISSFILTGIFAAIIEGASYYY